MEPAAWPKDIVAPHAVSHSRGTGDRNNGGPTAQAAQETCLFSKLADRGWQSNICQAWYTFWSYVSGYPLAAEAVGASWGKSMKQHRDKPDSGEVSQE